jgi:uncharacterized protein (TIGR00369 family)
VGVPLKLPFPLKDGFNQLLGIEVTDWGPGRATLSIAVRDELHNLATVVHGGVLASLIDTACNLAGAWSDAPGQRRIPLTLTLTTNFVAGARKGPLTCTARRTGGGSSTFMAESDVTDADGRLVATGQAVMRFISTPRGRSKK